MKRVMFLILVLVMMLALALPVLADGPAGECPPNSKSDAPWQLTEAVEMESKIVKNNGDGYVCILTDFNPFPSKVRDTMFIDNRLPLSP